MSTLGGAAITMIDLAKRMDPDGKMAKIIEVLMQTNGMYDDMTFVPCNDGSSHQTTIRTGLPDPTWRMYNQGVAPSKGTTAQIKATTGMLHANSVVDADLAARSGNIDQFRADEATAHIAGMGQGMASALLYDDERTNPQRITGFMAHYATGDTTIAASAENVLDGGGSGIDNQSIIGIEWGPLGITGLVPQGSKAGLVHERDAECDIVDATGVAGATFRGLRDRFQMHTGLCVRDWSRGWRIANLDISALVAVSGQADLVKLLGRAIEHWPDTVLGTRVIYVSRSIRMFLREAIQSKIAYNLTWETVNGKRVMVYDDVIVRRNDALVDEAAVTGF